MDAVVQPATKSLLWLAALAVGLPTLIVALAQFYASKVTVGVVGGVAALSV